MSDTRPLGIAVAATGIPKEVCDRFTETLRRTTSSDFICELVTETEDYSLSKCRNQGILSLMGRCRVVVCVDVDMLVPPGLVDYALENTQDGKAVWAKCRNLEPDQLEDLDWDKWINLSVRECGTGSWISMTTADWLRVGGWDERITSYGGEDDTLVIRRKEKGIETKITRAFPLIHINHQERHHRTTEERLENLNLGLTQPTENFLTGKLSTLEPAHNHFNIFTTTRCTRDCPQCSQRGFRAWSDCHSLSLVDLTTWIACTKESAYPLYDSVILTGGEPLLWENAEEGAHLLRQAEVSHQLNLFSNGDCLDRVTDGLMESLTTLRLSHYGNNTRKVGSLQKRYGSKVSVIDRRQHFPIPTSLADTSVLPARCGCEGPTLIGQRVYGCSMLVTVANEFGIDLAQYPESHCRLQVGYLELLACFPRTRHNCCRGCIGNLSLRKNLVSANQ